MGTGLGLEVPRSPQRVVVRKAWQAGGRPIVGALHLGLGLGAGMGLGLESGLGLGSGLRLGLEVRAHLDLLHVELLSNTLTWSLLGMDRLYMASTL